MIRMDTSESPQTLGEWVEDRVAELEMSWDEFATKAGVSYETVREIRNGTRTNFRLKTKGGLQRALRWDRRSIDRIRSGLPPIPLEEENQDDPDIERIRANRDLLGPDLADKLEALVRGDEARNTYGRRQRRSD